MSAQNMRRHVFVTTGSAIDFAGSTGDTVLYEVCVPIKIVRWGVILTAEAGDVGAGWELSIDRRPTPASDTDREEISKMTGDTTDRAVGKVLERQVGVASTTTDPAVDGSITVAGQSQGFVCDIGDEIVFDVDNIMDTTGQGQVFFEYVLLGMDDGDQTDRVTYTA